MNNEWKVTATNRRPIGMLGCCVTYTARAEENRHWRRLGDGQPNGRPAVLDNAYMDAVDRADQIEVEVLEAARAAEREREI